MKPGRVKRAIRVDWFTLLFEFSTIAGVRLFTVVSFNGATMLILRHEVFTLHDLPQAYRHLNLFRTFSLTHSSSNTNLASGDLRAPLPGSAMAEHGPTTHQ